jgi:hypothetical protein
LRLAFDLDVPAAPGETDEQFTWSVNRALAEHLRGGGGKGRGAMQLPDLFFMDQRGRRAAGTAPG